MARSRRKPAVLLDWFNISYSTLYLLGGVLVVCGAAAYWYWFHQRPSGAAAAAIHRAESKFDQASACEVDSRLSEMLGSARSSLTQAQVAFEGRSYPRAREAALLSENFSQRVIDIAGGARSDEQQPVQFLAIEGEVRVKRSGEFSWEPADRRTVLGIGDQIKTSSSASAQIIYFDGTVTTIQPGSLLEIRDLYEHPVTKVRRVKQKLSWGELMASTQKRNVEGSFHEVTTETAAARATEEGEFRVVHDKRGKTTQVDSFSGTVEVAGSGERTVLSGGERIRANAGGALSAKEALPPRPRLVSPPDQRIFVTDNTATERTQLAWERVPSASRYRLMIARHSLFTDPIYDAERRDTSAEIKGMEAGDYYWKVAAISSAGRQGTFSETRQFRVSAQTIRNVGDNVPPELQIEDLVQTGAMLIVRGRSEPGAQVWVDNEKVEVSDDGSFYTVVRLRREGLNRLQFVAQDAAGNRRALDYDAYVDSY